MIFKLELSAAQLEILGQGLDELKFKMAAPVANAIQAQINAQLAAAQKPAEQLADPAPAADEPTADDVGAEAETSAPSA